jgi:hypothetical protein
MLSSAYRCYPGSPHLQRGAVDAARPAHRSLPLAVLDTGAVMRAFGLPRAKIVHIVIAQMPFIE